MDKKTIKELLQYILYSINLIEQRYSCITTYHDFMLTQDGIEKFDAICMRLQTIGEALKNIHKHNSQFLIMFEDESYWSNIIKFREIVSHHYIDIDPEIVFEICNHELTKLKNLISKMIAHK
jgi:uncharacterized protein with HEPN domain